MARLSRTTRSRARTRYHRGSAAPRPLPAQLLEQATEIVSDRPLSLAAGERARLRALVVKARGRGINLSPRERSEVAQLIEHAGTAVTPRPMPTPRIAPRRAR